METRRDIYKLIQTVSMLDGKRGTGKSKETRVNIKMTIRADKLQTMRAIERLFILLDNGKLFFESEVDDVDIETDYKDNPDWEEPCNTNLK